MSVPKRYKRLATMTNIREGFSKVAEPGYNAVKAAVENGELKPSVAMFALATGLLPAKAKVLI